jgi:hypothetical protein
MKLAVLTGVVVAASLALILWLGEADPASSHSGPGSLAPEILAAHRRGQELEEARQGVRRFQEEMGRMKAALLEGSLCLDEAAACLVEATRRDNPGFLRTLEFATPELPPQEQMIRCLLRHFDVEEALGQLTPAQREAAARLRRALELATKPR